MRQREHGKSWRLYFFRGKENRNHKLGTVFFLYTVTSFSLFIICFSLLFSNYSIYVLMFFLCLF